MNFIKSKKIFYINSRNRKNGTDSDFEIQVDMPSFQKFDKIGVLAIIVPKSYYNVQEGANTFILKEGSQEVTITHPPANYNRRSYARRLVIDLNDASPNGYEYDVTYPNALVEGDDGKYIFTVSGAIEQPSFILDDNGLFELMGFDANSTNTFINGSLKSANVCKIQSEDVLRLHSNISDNGGDDVLLEIYSSSVQSFTNIVWNCPDIHAYSRDITSKSTNTYRFFLTNEDDQKLNLNGLNFCFTIIVYESGGLLLNSR